MVRPTNGLPKFLTRNHARVVKNDWINDFKEQKGKNMTKLIIKLSILMAIFCSLAFAAGYWTAQHNAAMNCTTDTNCMEKYGDLE